MDELNTTIDLKKENNDNIEKSGEVRYPASSRMFDTVLYEFNYEYERFKGFQSRAGIIFSFITALIFYLFQSETLFKCKDILSIKITTLSSFIIYTILFLVYTITVLCLFFSLYYSLKVFFPENSIRPGYETFKNSNGTFPKDILEMAYIQVYIEALKSLTIVNNKKSKQFRKLLFMVSGVIVFFVISTFLNIIILL